MAGPMLGRHLGQYSQRANKPSNVVFIKFLLAILDGLFLPGSYLYVLSIQRG